VNRCKAGAISGVLLLAAVTIPGCPPRAPEGKPRPAETPVFDPPGGTYPQAVDVTITCASPDAVIYYTTDQSEPSEDNGTVYTAPLHLTVPTTIKACAYKDGMLPSLVATAVYTIGTSPPAENKPPRFLSKSVFGTFQAGQTGGVTLACAVIDDDGTVASVTADLAAIGGSAAHALRLVSGPVWTWSGELVPQTAGNCTITLTAADNHGARTTETLTVEVASPTVSQEKWHFATGDWIWSSPAQAADGTIYIGSLDGKVYAINPDGTQKWSLTTGSYVYSSPAIGPDGTVYVGSRDFKLYALNPDGSKKWEFDGLVDASPAVAEDGTIYIGSIPDGEVASLYAINPDGSVKWQFGAPGSIWSSPAIGPDGTVYFGARDFQVYAVDADGWLKWQFYAGDQVDSSPAIAADGTVYVGCRNGRLYAIDAGEEKWSLSLGGPVDSSPAIGPDGTIYVGSSDGNLYAVNPDGTEKWHYATAGEVDSSPAVGADGSIYVGSRDGRLYAVQADGTELWKFETGGPVLSSPLLGSNGTLYVGSYDGRLYAVQGAPAVADSDWPMFRRDARHTAKAPAAPANRPPQITNAIAEIHLADYLSSTLRITCTVSDPDGDAIESVTADLMQFYGSSAEPLRAGEDSTWTWSGNVHMYVETGEPIRITATDSRGGSTAVLADVTVISPNLPPEITGISISNPLRKGVESLVTLTCTVADPDGTVASVAADLGPIGGPAIGALQSLADGQWRWSGYVTPGEGGRFGIVVTALDDMGLAATASFTVDVFVPLTISASSSQHQPAISGSLVSWRDTRGGNSDIYAVDLFDNTEIPICLDIYDQSDPATNGTWVIWSDTRNGGYDIYGYSLETGTETLIAGGPGFRVNPAISGNLIVWEEYRTGNWDIYGYDLATMTGFAVCTAGGDQKEPAISGNLVVWEDMRSGNWDIYGCTIGPNKEITELPICTFDTEARRPAVDGDRIVWMDGRNGNWDIYGYDMSVSREFPVVLLAADQAHPAIARDLVVWEDNRSGEFDVYGKRLPDGPEFLIDGGVGAQSRPALSTVAVPGAGVSVLHAFAVWEDGRSGTYDIYGVDMPWDVTVLESPGR